MIKVVRQGGLLGVSFFSGPSVNTMDDEQSVPKVGAQLALTFEEDGAGPVADGVDETPALFPALAVRPQKKAPSLSGSQHGEWQPKPQTARGRDESGSLLPNWKACLIDDEAIPDSEFPVNSLYCLQHKRSVAALIAQEKKKALAEVAALVAKGEIHGDVLGKTSKSHQHKLSPSWQAFEKVTNERGNAWRALVVTYDYACPSAGKGKTRGEFDTMCIIQEITHATIMDTGFELEYMNKRTYIDFAVTKKYMTVAQAEVEWDKTFNETAEDEKKQKADGVCLPIHVRDFIVGKNRVAKSKIVQFLKKAIKNFGEDDVKKTVDDSSRGHIRFNSNTFSSVGQHAAARVARTGQSVVVSPSGTGAFDTADGAALPTSSASVASSAEGDAPKASPGKNFDVERARNKVIQQLDESLSALKTEAREAHALVSATSAEAKSVEDEDASGAVSRYMSTLEFRADLLKALYGGDAAFDGPTKQKYLDAVPNAQKELQCFAKVVAVAIEQKSSLAVDSEKVSVATATVGPIFGGEDCSPTLRTTLLAFNFDGTKFTEPPNWASMIDKVQLAFDEAQGEALWAGFVEKARLDKRPMPIAEVGDLISLTRLCAMVVAVSDVVEEFSLKEQERILTRAVKGVAAVVQKVKQACADVKQAIVSKKRKADSLLLRADQAATKKAAAAAKASTKMLDKEKEAVKKANMAAIFVFKGGPMQAMPKFQSIEDFKTNIADKSFECNKGLPYIVDNASGTVAHLTDANPIKQMTAVFKAQFPTTVQALRDGRCQCPLKTPNVHQLKELMLEVAPSTAFHLNKKDAKDTFIQNIGLDCVSLYGFTESMVYGGVDYQGLSNLRLQLKGGHGLFIA